jgi:CheY-like chemotaxis protein
MRDPLNAILGMARLLAETPLDNEQRGYLAAIEDAADTLLTLVNDLLDLARVEAGQLQLADRDFDLLDFLERLCTMLRPRAEAAGQRLSQRIGEGVPMRVRGDPARLRQVLFNLLGNALKYAGPCTVRLEVTAGSCRDGLYPLCFRVVDEGRGMAAETLARLFEPWARGPEEQAGGPTGSGLGMLLAKRIVEHMGGTLAITSAPGRGTAAEVRLELAAAEPLPTSEKGHGLSGQRLLLVDPHPRTALRNAALLRALGMTVVTTSSLAEAEAGLEQGALPAFIILDRDAAGPDFTGFARRLRARPGGEHVRLVLLSAAGLRGDADIAQAAGYDAYLAKPVSVERLETCLMALADGRPATLLTQHELEPAAAQALTVLVADDNPVNRRLLAILLERLGHRVLEATDGVEALAVLEREAIDLVLLDVQMPVLDGLGTVARIRALRDPAKASVPVVAVTANALPDEVESYLRAGMSACLAKPVDRLALRQLLARCRSVG